MNRTLVFLSIIIVFVLLAGGVYFFVLRDTNPAPSGQNPVFTPGGDPVTIPGEGSSDDFVIDDRPIARTILTQIHEKPTAGARARVEVLEVTTGSTTEEVRTPVVDFVDAQTGHIFTYDTESLSASRISNTTFPGIEEVFWFSNPNRLVLRYVNDAGEIETYLGGIEEGGLQGSYLDLDIPVVQTYADSLVYVNTTQSGSEGIETTDEGRGGTTQFETPLTSLVLSGFSDVFTLIYPKPVSQFPGSLYMYKNGSPTRLVGNLPGLVGLSNDVGNTVLYSYAVERGFASLLLDIASGESRRLPLALFPEKCVWSDDVTMYCMVPEVVPPANYPEHWYQGYLSFTDALWRVDVDTGVARALAFFDESGPFDGISLSIDEEGEYLTFINRRDGSLWGFDL